MRCKLEQLWSLKPSSSQSKIACLAVLCVFFRCYRRGVKTVILSFTYMPLQSTVARGSLPTARTALPLSAAAASSGSRCVLGGVFVRSRWRAQIGPVRSSVRLQQHHIVSHASVRSLAREDYAILACVRHLRHLQRHEACELGISEDYATLACSGPNGASLAERQAAIAALQGATLLALL